MSEYRVEFPIAIDPGNYGTQVRYGDEKKDVFEFPSVSAVVGGDFEKNPSPPDNILNDLKVKLTSEALSYKTGKRLIGLAATKDAYRNEYTEGTEKWKGDIPIETILTATAKRAVDIVTEPNDFKDWNTINAEVKLYTGLPIDEAKDADRIEFFRNRLLNNEHTIIFYNANDIFNKKEIKITFKDVIVNDEASAAHDLIMSCNEPWIEELRDNSYILVPIGGGTMEIGIINSGVFQSDLAESHTLGITPAIDRIMKKSKVTFASKEHFIKAALNGYEVKIGGKRKESFKAEAGAVFNALVTTVLQRLDRAFEKAGDAAGAVFIGGAPALLKDFLLATNEDRRNLLFFEDSEFSRWLIVNAYWETHKLMEDIDALVTNES